MQAVEIHVQQRPENLWATSVDEALPLVLVDPRQEIPNSRRVERRHQITLSEWTSFIPNALTFDFNEFKQKPSWREYVDSRAIRIHDDTFFRLEHNVANFFEGSSLGSIADPDSNQETTQSVDRRQCLMIGEVELVGRNLDGEIRGLVHINAPWVVRITEKELVALFNERGLHEPTVCAIVQIVGYMIDNRCKYGVLSTYNETRFLCAEDRDHIAISDVILADAKTVTKGGAAPCSVTLRRAFGYWLHLCTQPEGLLLFADASAGGAVSLPLLKKRHVMEGGWCDSEETLKPLLSPGPLALVASHSLFVPWSELQIVDLLGAGRSGSVVLGRRGSLEFALKLFDVGKSVEGFERELRAYTMLQSTNAKAVKLLLVTHSPSEQVFGLGLQLARPLPPLKSWSQKQREGAMAALQSLLAVGIMQNDVREYNFVEDASGEVLAIDFEDISVVDQDGVYIDCNKEGWEKPKSPASYLDSAWYGFTHP